MSLFLSAVLVACGLLAIGFVLRATLRPLQVLYMPAAVTGGLVGLAAIQLLLRLDAVPRGVSQWARDLAAEFNSWPAVLIAVVFSGLLLERSGKRFGEAVGRAARQGLVVWIIVVGQAVIGLTVVWLIIRPMGYDIPYSVGQLIETGFAGGHGTAAAMGQIWTESLGFEAGRDLAFFFAMFGLIWGVVSGIFFVNLGIRRGWVRRAVDATETTIPVLSGLEARHDPRPAALARVRGEVIDPFVFQLLIVAAAFAVGWALQWLFIRAAAQVADEATMRFLGNIPLFLFTLMGGWIVRELLHGIGAGDLIDGDSIRRIVAAAMEFLIVAAIAALRIEALTLYFVPVLLLLAAGVTWSAVALLLLAPRLLPREYWFELGLLNYGMSLATTAQGMMLLRIVDRELDSGAAEDYAIAAPMSAPFIGGGVITLTLPLLLQHVHVGLIVALLLLAMLACTATAWLLARRALPG